MMLKQMENLLKNESQGYYENFLGLDHLKERHQYLQKMASLSMEQSLPAR